MSAMSSGSAVLGIPLYSVTDLANVSFRCADSNLNFVQALVPLSPALSILDEAISSALSFKSISVFLLLHFQSAPARSRVTEGSSCS